MYGSGRETIPDVLEAYSGCPGVIGKPLRMSGRCREALPDVR